MSDLIGRKLGKYTLETRLGEGGMAAVFSSHHPQFHRPVAIKILPPTIGQDPSFRARFEREGRTIASLNHSNIIRVYDIDESDGLFYMVMDLLPGGTLETRLREGGLDRKWSADVIVKMAEALDYAHARGVIHRDIKPSNILLDAEGQPVLADFGIARLVQSESEPNLTSAGMVMGTPAYMAPEQLTGGQPDARSDIYSLGVVLYQLLAGRAPFTGDTMAVVSAHLTKQPPALRDYVHDLPPALDAVVLQALAKQPEHRFKSAGVFAQALRNAAADLEPGMVRVSSAAREVAAPTFSDVRLPQSTSSAGQTTVATPQLPVTTGQKVTQFLPVVLSTLGVLVLGIFLINNLFLVIVLALLVGGGAYAYMYFSASTQGRKAAAETTRAISTATIRAATAPGGAAPDQPRPTVTLEDHDTAPASIEPAPVSPAPPLPFDDRDDTPEMPLPDPMPEISAAAPADSQDLAPTEAVHFVAPEAPTEAMPASPAPEAPTEAMPASPAPEAPTEAMPASPAPEAPTEAMPASPAPEAPTEAVPAAESEPLAPTVAVPAAPPEEEQKAK